MMESVLVPKKLYDQVFLGLTIDSPSQTPTDHIFLAAFTKKQKERARIFLDFFKDHNITINDKGELGRGDQCLEDSHVVDLIKDCFHHCKHEPKHLDRFYRWMKECNMPQSFIKDVSRRERFIRQKNIEGDGNHDYPSIEKWISL